MSVKIKVTSSFITPTLATPLHLPIHGTTQHNCEDWSQLILQVLYQPLSKLPVITPLILSVLITI